MWMQLLWQRAQEKNTVLINWSDGEGVEAQRAEPINWPHKQRTICNSPGLHLSLRGELPSLRQADGRTATKPVKPPHFDPAHRVPRCWSISGQLKQLLTTQTSCSYWVLNPDSSPTPCADSCRTFLSTNAANPDVCSCLPVRPADRTTGASSTQRHVHGWLAETQRVMKWNPSPAGQHRQAAKTQSIRHINTT